MNARRKIPVGHCDTSSRSSASRGETLIFVCSEIAIREICCCSRRSRIRAPKLSAMRTPRGAAHTLPHADDQGLPSGRLHGSSARRAVTRNLGRGGPARRGLTNLPTQRVPICVPHFKERKRFSGNFLARKVFLRGDYSCFFLSFNYLSQIEIVDFPKAIH